MKATMPMRIRASRFLTDRYAYRERPDYLIEFVAQPRQRQMSTFAAEK